MAVLRLMPKAKKKMVLTKVKPASIKLTPKKSYTKPKYGKLV